MLGSWKEHNTLEEQIKNISRSNSWRIPKTEMGPAPLAAKNCTQMAVLIVTK
jgi:hypothetical protein